MDISISPLPFSEFSRQVSEVWDASLEKKQIKPYQAAHRDEFENKCYQLYLNAFHGKLPFMVIGHEVLCESVEMLYNFGVLTADAVFCKKEIKGPLPPELKQGAVLSQHEWAILLNDSYILGAIHASKSFHLYEPEGLLPDKNFWDPSHRRPRVLGRELMMLKAAGFNNLKHPYPEMEAVFVPKEGRKPCLKELIEASEKTESLAEIKEFIRNPKGPISPTDLHRYNDASQKV